jgi:dCMP deaminase
MKTVLNFNKNYKSTNVKYVDRNVLYEFPASEDFIWKYKYHYELNFMRMAFTTALTLSKDPNTKVGAVICTPDFRHVSLGYNGFPKGVEETPEKWKRPTKYLYAVHAEENSLLNSPFDTAGCYLFCTLKPCHSCMGRIINAGIKKVFFYVDRLHEHEEICEELSNHVEMYEMMNDEVIDNIILLNGDKFCVTR